MRPVRKTATERKSGVMYLTSAARMIARASRVLKSILLAALLSAVFNARAQTDYDTRHIEDRFSLSIGAYEQVDYQTKIRLSDDDLGIGAVLDLEDSLNVEKDTGTVLRLDGHYRFNRAHRVEWTWYGAERTGFVEIFDENISIGDLDFRFGSNVESEIEFGVFKLGYAWSFVNTRSWELHAGAGLNFYRDRLKITRRLFTGQDVDVREFEEEGESPLPTVSFGVRYRPAGRWIAYWDYEVVAVELGDYSGRLQESLIGIEHNTWEHVGFGLGVVNSGDFVEMEDGDNTGEFDSDYQGWRVYLKTYF